MPYGYTGKILHVDLNTGQFEVEQPDELFYRKYLGGSAMGTYYLLKNTPAHADPLGPENVLSLMLSVVTGAPISGQSRVAAVAKSPYSGLVAESTAGGFWPAQLKFAGFDGIVIRGRAEKPVYLWVHNGEAELRDAGHLWGKFTADAEDDIHDELGDKRIEVLQCGPAAEQGVLFGALLNRSRHANGRKGMGTVMASKNLKGVAVRGRSRPQVKDPEALRALAKWGAEHLDESGVASQQFFGTAGAMGSQSRVGGLPTRNWSSGTFEDAELISGQYMAEHLARKSESCYACVIRCKPSVEVTEGPMLVDRRYGGPEYETTSTMGSYCGVSDIVAVARANQLCNMYGMDTISCGATIAWAMDCYERGLLSKEDTEGLELNFGNGEAVVELVERIGKRDGAFGRLLGEGSVNAAQKLGVGGDLVVAVKNQEIPAHMPHVKAGLGLLYVVDPRGADHTVCEHDSSYGVYPDRMAELGLADPVPGGELNEEKVRYSVYSQRFISCIDSLCLCKFAFGPAWQLYGPSQMVETVRAVTGWNVSLWELMKAGERQLNLLRAFNARDGVGSEADVLPERLEVPLSGGATDGIAISRQEVEQAKELYYQMVGWDEAGRPTRAKLDELALGWLADELGL